MIPTLYPGQDVLSFNWFVNPKVGDVVIIKVGNKEMLKRVTKIDGRQIMFEGDNKEESTDSRHFGSVSMDQIVGKVIRQLADHPERLRRNVGGVEGSGAMVDCPSCSSLVVGIYGRKDAICANCGFKLSCCGEP